MTWPLSAAEAQRAGFAFVLWLPCELEDLLSLVAEALHHSFTAEQERQADVVRRYLAAQAAEDWESLLALCLPDVRYYPAPASVGTTARRLQGQTALRAYGEATAQHLHQVSHADLCLYARPKGLVAQYTSQWFTSDGRRQQVSTRLLFHFVGESISQIGVRPHLGGGAVQTRVG
jgi:ketosteroid isomerase-like protein